MQLNQIQALFIQHTETTLFHRYITNIHIKPLLERLCNIAKVETIGRSVLDKPIYGLQLGNGYKRVLMWSQMHGNESTTTKALFDLLNALLNDANLKSILNTCSLYIIPILNPDGAAAYTRVNANAVDLNRDAQNLSQPESQILRSIFNKFKPHFCFNLHGQRTIFSAGIKHKPATVSFLAPAQDAACTVTPTRQVAMELICKMNEVLQEIIPEQVGVYDDAFNLNCVGDFFQSKLVPTVLFEAGHFCNDYEREKTREFIFTAYIAALHYISTSENNGLNYKAYFKIPENQKRFFDVIIRNASMKLNSKEEILDIGIMFQEKLINGHVAFIPIIDKIENLSSYYGHKEIQANGFEVLDENMNTVEIGSENLFVIINNEKITIF